MTPSILTRSSSLTSCPAHRSGSGGQPSKRGAGRSTPSSCGTASPAQGRVSHTPLPQQARLAEAARRAPGFYARLLRAHRAAGLLVGAGDGADRAWGFVNLSPVKDMEVVVLAESLSSRGLHTLLNAALWVLTRDLGGAAFNVGVHNIEVDGSWDPPAEGMDWASGTPIMARVVSRGKLSSRASDFGGLEVFGGASIGNTDPYIVMDLLSKRLGDRSIDISLL
eukprot:CAMPEP_0177624068 /NCGR_PEP_ID=MMETSP0419_2-20121207/29272_1 /TAXON_ID=582737 /ORGANISM="Tetraselmis sp., Strain GSL018" /LENGTH=222 /DNA_ID=CAMNT_0019124729 /DNA_START=845 /DNA_END=1513 /DNA_ORIENTATION=-